MSAQQAALAHFLSYTKLSRAIAGVLAVTYIIGLVSPSSKQYIALVPGRFIPCVWNIATAGILELYLYKVRERAPRTRAKTTPSFEHPIKARGSCPTGYCT